MAYVPFNLQVFTAAFAGALAGMGASGRVINDPSQADYTDETQVAGAFAQSLDTNWGLSATNGLNIAAIEEACESVWQGRAPQAAYENPPGVFPFLNPATYATLSLAIIAMVKEGDAYFTAQGIVPPPAPSNTPEIVANLAALAALNGAYLQNLTEVKVATLDRFYELDKTSLAAPSGTSIVAATGGGNWLEKVTFSKKWSLAYLTGVFIDPFAGNDENNGMTDTAGNRLQTLAEACKRLYQANQGANYRYKVTDTDPAFGGVPATDRWRPFMMFEQNVENVIPVTGNEQIFNATLEGDERVILALTTMTGAGYTKTAGGIQATVVDANLGTAGITANLGKTMVIINDPITPANNGAWAHIGAGPTEDAALAADTARINQFVRTDNSEATAMAAGTTYKIIEMTKFGFSLQQLPSAMRYLVKKAWFTAPAAAPADQENITSRYYSIHFIQCKISRPLDVSDGVNVLIGCAITDAAGDGTSVAQGAYNQNIFSPAVLINSLMLNVNCQAVNGTQLTLTGAYCEKSEIQTAAKTAFFSYGNFSVNGSGARGAVVIINGSGLGLYNWPAASNAGLRIKDEGLVKASADIHGGAQNNAQVCILVEGGSSELQVLSTITPTVGTGVGGTVVALDQINIDNPPAGGKIACWQNPTPLVAGAVVPTAAALNLWADWTNAATFNRHAFNPATGGRVTSVLAA